MKITRLSQCNKWLGVKTKDKSSVQLPAILWRNVVLKGHTEAVWGVELESEANLHHILPDIFQEISFSQYLHIIDRLNELGLPFDEVELSRAFGFYRGGDENRIANIIQNLPLEIKSWFYEKKFSFGDLQVLLAVNEISFLVEDLRRLTTLSGTHSELVLALEYIVELRLLNMNISNTLVGAMQSVLTHLKALRYPLNHSRQEDKKKNVSVLPWPKKMVARPVRISDQSGVEVKFFAHSKSELQKNIDGLVEVMKNMEQLNIERF